VLLQCGAQASIGDQDGERAEESARRRGRDASASVIASFRAGAGGAANRHDVCMPATAKAADSMRAFLRNLDAAKARWTPPPPFPSSSPASPSSQPPAEENKAACANAEATSDSSWYMWTPPSSLLQVDSPSSLLTASHRTK
jgi:hypothetical protein